MTKEFGSTILIAVITSGLVPFFVTKFQEWRKHKADEENAEQFRTQEQRERERDEWMRESKEAYRQVKNECQDCRKELERIKREEVEPLKRANAEMKNALLGRIEVLDRILPLITALPADEVRELQELNRAQRTAVFRGAW